MHVPRGLLAVGLTALLLTAGVAGGLGAAAAQSGSDCSYPLTVTDSTDTEITIEEEPETVVTLAPSAAQTMYEIGAQEKVIGISDRGTYLDWDEEKEIVSGDEGFVNTERVIAQDPDIVLAPDIISEEKVEQLRDAGLTVYHFGASETMDDVVEKTRLIGQLTGECEGADAKATEMEQTLDTVAEAVDGEDSPRVLYVFAGYTSGEGTFIDEILTTAGATNVASEAGISGFQMVSDEVVANQSPEWIVVNDEAPGIPDKEAYNETPAVQNDQIVTVNAHSISQAAPRTIDVVEHIASELHPEAYESAQATTTEDTQNEDTTAVTTETEAPGFGPIVALLALGGAAFLRRD
ncbi:MAG: PGF-CTERM-anchored ABC transporter substrate-binding protein [Halobacteriota archaeon]